MDPDEAELRDVARALIEEVGRLTDQVAALDRTMRRGRWLAIVGTMAIAFVMSLSLWLFSISHENQRAIRAACEGANTTRIETVLFFDRLVDTLPASSPEGKAAMESIRSLAHDTFKPQEC